MKAVLVAALVLMLAPSASAHRLDEYLQATRIALSRDQIVVEIDLTPGAAVAPALLAVLDRDDDDQISEAEFRSYAARWIADLSLGVDGHPMELDLLHVATSSVQDLADGLGSIHLEAEARSVATAAGTHWLSLENRHQRGSSAYVVNALKPGGLIEITGQERDVEQRTIRIDYRVRGRRASLSWLGAVGVLVGLLRLRWRFESARPKARAYTCAT